MKHFILVFFILCISIYIFYVKNIYAQHIEINTVEIRENTSHEPNVTPTSSPPASFLFSPDKKKLFDQKGFVTISKKEQPSYFRFETSHSSVSFGAVDPDTKSQESINISIMSSTQLPYQIQTYQKHPLKTTRNEYIIKAPNSISHAQPWTKQDIYGIGYNIKGENAPSDFKDETYFRTMPYLSKNEQPQIISKGIIDTIPASTIITFKIQFPPIQKQGTYASNIYFIIIPE